MTAPANPFAFPLTPEIWATHHDFCGMTLRDWFAGQALNAVMKDRALIDEYCGTGPKIFAEVAYGIADAMLLSRQNGEGGK